MRLDEVWIVGDDPRQRCRSDEWSRRARALRVAGICTPRTRVSEPRRGSEDEAVASDPRDPLRAGDQGSPADDGEQRAVDHPVPVSRGRRHEFPPAYRRGPAETGSAPRRDCQREAAALLRPQVPAPAGTAESAPDVARRWACRPTRHRTLPVLRACSVVAGGTPDEGLTALEGATERARSAGTSRRDARPRDATRPQLMETRHDLDSPR